MKSIKNLLAILLVFVSSLLLNSKVFAQAALNGGIVGLPLPPHDVLYSPTTHIMTIMGGTYPNGVTLNALGVNTEQPNYKLDVMGDADTNDINISCANCYPLNSGGYRIGGSQVLYTGGDLTSIFVGAQAPVSAAYFLSHGQNSCLGYGVCPNIAYGHSNQA